MKEESNKADRLLNQKDPFEGGVCREHWHAMEEEQAQQKAEYLDLMSNREAYTGYDGRTIWQLIYAENCFRGQEMCQQERALERIISGVHTSITVQLSEYYRPKDDFLAPYRPNLTLFLERLEGRAEYGQNLHFTFALLLRALQIYLPQINATAFETRHPSDQQAQALVRTIAGMEALQGRPLFREDQFFGSSQPLKASYRRYIHNISKLLDCVGCEKCKVYGKLQFFGIASTLKALFGESVQLTRNELIVPSSLGLREHPRQG